MTIEIRRATVAERARCLSWWQRSVFGRLAKKDGTMWANFGRGQVHVPMAKDTVDEMLAAFAGSCRIEVAVLAGEPLGFVAFDVSVFAGIDHGPMPLHYIFVTGEARRKGLGTMLFRHAVKGEYQPTFMTRAGRELEEHALRLIAAEQGPDVQRESQP